MVSTKLPVRNLIFRFVARPCINFRLYYYISDPDKLPDTFRKGTILTGETGEKRIDVVDIEKLSDVPPEISLDKVLIGWDYAEENMDIDERELISEVDKLLSYYWFGEHLSTKDSINLGPLFSFANKYGILFEFNPRNHNFNQTVLPAITHHMVGFWIIRACIKSDYNVRTFLPWFYNDMCKAVKNFKKQSDIKSNTYYLVSTPTGFVVEGVKLDEMMKALHLRIPFNKEGFIQNIIDDYEEMRQDPEYVPDLFLEEMKRYALESVMQYLSTKNLAYSPILDEEKITFQAIVSSPTVYYLLSMKPKKLNKQQQKLEKQQRDLAYSKKPYPKTKSYFRTQCLRNIITKDQYQRAKERARILCVDENCDYEEAKIMIQSELEGDE